MASDKEKPLPNVPEEEGREDKVYGNVLTELESVDLPLGTTLRYFQTNLNKLLTTSILIQL